MGAASTSVKIRKSNRERISVNTLRCIVLQGPEAKRSCLGNATPTTEYTPAASPTLTEVMILISLISFFS